MRLLPLAVFVLLALTALWILPALLSPEGWAEGSRHGNWIVRFSGYGKVSGDDTAVTLAPTQASAPSITHGALVVDGQEHGDLSFEVTVKTESQTRSGSAPNPWEVGWVLWHVADADHFYALVVKPNGWELSKQDPAYRGKQRFLLSGNMPTFPVGQPHTLVVRQSGSSMIVLADGQELGAYTDEERPYLRGSIGLYAEDAVAVFTDFRLLPTPSFTPTALDGTSE